MPLVQAAKQRLQTLLLLTFEFSNALVAMALSDIDKVHTAHPQMEDCKSARRHVQGLLVLACARSTNPHDKDAMWQEFRAAFGTEDPGMMAHRVQAKRNL